MSKFKNLWLRACLILIAFWASNQFSFAYSFKVDGIYYDIISGTKNASVTYMSTTTTSGYGGGFTTYNSPYSGNVVIPAIVEYNGVKYTVTRIGNHAFDDSEVETVMLPNTITEVYDGAFTNCGKLKEILLPNTVTYIGKNAFSYCTSLKSFIIPPSMLNSINDYVFYGCTSLEDLYIPSKVNNFRLWACNNLYSLCNIYDYATEAQGHSEGPVWSNLKSGQVHVAADLSSSFDGFPIAGGSWKVVEDLQMVSSVTISSNMDVTVGSTTTIEAIVLPSNASNKQLFWNSSNPDVASVTHKGVVTTKKVGTTTITAESTDGSGIIKTCVLTVKEPTLTLVDGNVYNVNNQKDYSSITYSRTFNNTNWQALYVPFSMSYDDWKDDFEMAKINNVNMYDTDDDGNVDETVLEIIKIKKGSLKPNNPYLIKAKTVGDKSIILEDATVYPAAVNSLDVSSSEMKFTFTGTYSGVSGSEMVTNKYYALSAGALSYTESSSISLKPYRWYMKVESRDPQVMLQSMANSRIRIKVVGEDETTGVDNVENVVEDSKIIYSIDGRVAGNNGTAGLRPGVYFSNGKKFIVK